ncbi:hypothetical protein M9458_023908, partial [Cirrhinus mrigala]
MCWSAQTTQRLQHRLKLLCATYIPGDKLHPQMVQLAQVDVFTSPESTHCQWWYGLTEAPLGTDALTHERLTQARLSPTEPYCTDSVQCREGYRADSSGTPVSAQQNLILGASAPIINPSLAHSSEKEPPFSGKGHNLAPAPRSLELPSMVPGRDQEDSRNFPPALVSTLMQARAPSTRRLYVLELALVFFLRKEPKEMRHRICAIPPSRRPG